MNTKQYLDTALDADTGAGVLLAVAPHGALDTERMPEALKTPAGGPDIWWYAVFDPVD